MSIEDLKRPRPHWWTRRFGPAYEKPCKNENVIACSRSECQKANECQITDEAECAQLKRQITALIASFRVNMMRLHPEYNHAAFDAEIKRIMQL